MDCLLAAESRLHPITKEPICSKARRVESFTSLAATKLKGSWILLQRKRILLQTGVFQRWDVAWEWQTVLLSMVACGVRCIFFPSFRARTVVHWYLLLPVVMEQAYQGGFSRPYRESSAPPSCKNADWKEPFNLRNGWLLWARIGLMGAIIAIALAGTALTIFNGEQPQRETDALVRLLPLIGSSGISTACLLGVTGVLAPVLEETVFRGFLMTSLTKWFPTLVSALISAAVFALAHLTPGGFPQLFVLVTSCFKFD